MFKNVQCKIFYTIFVIMETTVININDKAKQLIEQNSKIWLAERLGISRVTLDTRLELDNWKKSERHLIYSLK